jgi:hypothetical protein
MRPSRIVLTTALPLLLVLSAGTPTLGAAAATEPKPSTEVIQRRIEHAERRLATFQRRAERWQARIATTAARMQRLDWISRYAAPVPDEGEAQDGPRDPRVTDGKSRAKVPVLERLRRAHRALRRVLTEAEGRNADQQVQAWALQLDRLHAEMDAAVAREAEPDTDVTKASGAFDPSAPLTYEAWARSFLERLQAPDCSENRLVVVAWEAQEGTAAAFNPLATTRDMPGATAMNSVGVRNYASLEQGLDASRDTLELGAAAYRYGAILEALRSCARAEVTAGAIRDSAWCSGCGGGSYLVALIPVVRERYVDHASRLVSMQPA